MINYENAVDSDRFLAVRELKLTGLRTPNYNRRADLERVVNGLPLVFPFSGANRYGRGMFRIQRHSNSAASAAADQLLAEAVHFHAIEGKLLTAEEIAMFEMFQREGWPPERRRSHVLRRIEDRGRVAAAE